MKRPTIALLSLLGMLTLGLVAANPRSVKAGSLGELAFAIQVESTDAGDPIVCPRVCCPFADEQSLCEEVQDAAARMELNPAESTDDADTQLADDNTYEDEYYDYDDEYYYDEYGYEYGEEYEPSEETTDETEVADAEVDEQSMELNAPETEADDQLADEQFEDYYGDYADEYDYTEFGSDYQSEDWNEDATAGDEPCNDVAHAPTELPCELPPETASRCEISDADLLVAGEEEATAEPFDQYGRQVGDDYASDDDVADVADDYDYFEEDYYYEYGQYNDEYSDEASEVEAEPAADAAVEDYYDDFYYEAYYRYEYSQFGEEPAEADVDETVADEVAEVTDEATNEYEEDYYEDYYYEEYYGEDVDAAEASDESYEDDYERYYSEEYYEQLEDPSATDVSDESDDTYTSEYDAIYDDAVYGDTLETAENVRDDLASPPEVAEVAVDEAVANHCIQDAYVAGDCIDESNASLTDDLPWADDVYGPQEADVAELDVPADSSDEVSEGEASEYGSDYAEEYYDEYYDSLYEELEPLEEADPAPAACEEHFPTAAAKTLRSNFDVSRLASYCGSQVASWTETLSGVGRVIRTAATEINFETRTR